MTTQLLEDIGQSAPLSPAPPAKAGPPTAGKAEQTVAPARSASFASETRQPDQAAAPPDLDSVFEEIAALEAQYQPPAQQHEPSIGPAPEPAIEPTTPREKAVPTPAEPRFARDPAQADAAPTTPTARQDPLFDFTLPLPEQQASDPFTPPPSMLGRPRRRYLLWAACALTGALLVQGGWWLYKERKDDGSLAFIATQAQEAPRADRAAPEGVQAGTAATPAAPPPLVMLEPDPPAAAAPPEQAQVQQPSEPEPAAAPETPAPPPRPAGRVIRRQPDAATRPATARVKREPAGQIDRAPRMQAESAAAGEGAMTALLRACRAHGYHATQCIKQGCSVTRYGFACRGR